MTISQIAVQECGCIALTPEMATALKAGPGSVLQATTMPDGTIRIERVSPPIEGTDLPIAGTVCPR
jgi:hypothetical protein